MSESDLEARIDAVERAITDGADLDGVRDSATLSSDVDDLDDRVTDLEERLAELEAAVQAVRGYAGNVRAVNRDVERRANAALATVERLERSMTDPETAETCDQAIEPGSDRTDASAASHAGEQAEVSRERSDVSREQSDVSREQSDVSRERSASSSNCDTHSGLRAGVPPNRAGNPERPGQSSEESGAAGARAEVDREFRSRRPQTDECRHDPRSDPGVRNDDRSGGCDRGPREPQRANGSQTESATESGRAADQREGDCGRSKRTERFIERVRDAL